MASKKRDKGKKATIGQRIDEWDVSPTKLELLLNAIVAFIVFLVILSTGLFSLSFQRHLVLLIVIPVLVFFALSLPGIKLRLREKRSLLLFSDVTAVICIILLCLYMDDLYNRNDGLLIFKSLFCFVGIWMYIAYLSRALYMFYLTVPVNIIYNVFLMQLYGVDAYLALFLIVLLTMVFLSGISTHSFYFGIGRKLVDGKYVLVPESEAREYRKAERQRIREEKDARRAASRKTHPKKG